MNLVIRTEVEQNSKLLADLDDMNFEILDYQLK